MATTLLDGSVLEGGGQLLRNAVSFSALLTRPVSIFNVRGHRKDAGLKPQHVAGINLVAEICGAHVEGASQDSTLVSFHPTRVVHGSYIADPGTAGSTTLLLQIGLPCLLFADAPSNLTLRGGTNATTAPQIDYTVNVFLPFLARHLKLAPTLSILRRGHYPKGGGEVALHITPVPRNTPLPAVILTVRGAITAVQGRAFVSGALPAHIARRMAVAARAHLVSTGVDPALINIEVVIETAENSVGNGSGIMLWAETDGGCVLGGSAVGMKGTDAGKTGYYAADELVRNMKHGGCVDENLQDQMIIFLALAQGKSTVATGPLTLHTRTAIWLAEQLTDAKFQTDDEADTGRTLISCTGIGLTSSFE